MLGIEGTKLVYIPGNKAGGYIEADKPHTIFVNSDCVGRDRAEIIAHEMVHLAQVKFYGLKMDEETGITKWKGWRIQYRPFDWETVDWEFQAITKAKYILNYLESKGVIL